MKTQLALATDILTIGVKTQRKMLKIFLPILFVLSQLLPAHSQTDSLTLIYPKSESVFLKGAVQFQWDVLSDTVTYHLQVSEDSSFVATTFDSSSLLTPFYTVFSLPSDTQLYWRVRAFDGLVHSNWSEVNTLYLLTPHALGNMQLWVRADSGTVGGTSISQWNGIGSLTQIDSVRRPTLVPAVQQLNGLPALNFDGNDYLDGGQSLELRTNDQTILIVFNSQNTNNTQYRLIQKRGHSTFTDGWCLAPRGFEWNSSVIEEGGQQVGFQSGCCMNDGNYRIASTVWDNSEATWDMNINSFVPSSPSVFMQSSGVLNGADITQNNNKNMTVGCSWNSPTDLNFFLNGNIAEIMVYHSALDSIKRTLAEQYLRFKYAPPVNLGRNIINHGFCTPTTLDAGDYFVSYLWSTGETTSSIQINDTGSYSVTATDIFGFTSYDEIVVDGINPMEDDTLSLCAGDSIIWDMHLSHSDYTFQWQDGSTDSSFTITGAGNYWVVVQDTSGCSISDSVVVKVNQCGQVCDASFTYTNSQNIYTFQNTSTGSSLSYLWLFGDGDSSTDQNPIHEFGCDIYNVCQIVSDTSGCSDTICKSISVNIDVLAEVTFVERMAAYGDFPWGCPDPAWIISAIANDSIVSSYDDTVRRFFDGMCGTTWSPSIDTLVYHTNTDASAIILSLAGWENNCIAGGDPYGFDTFWYCPDADTMLAVCDSLMSINFRNDPSNQWNYYLTPWCGNYRYGVRIYWNCAQSSCNASFSYTNSQGVYTFHNTSTGNNLSYQWNFGDGNSSVLQNPVHSFFNDGSYNVCLIVFDTSGCADTSCAVINVSNATPESCCNTTTSIITNTTTQADSAFAIWATAFSPNGDANNETWRVYASAHQSISITVSRNGEIVYQSNDVNQTWNGTCNGFPVDGQFEVHVLLTAPSGGVFEKTGTVCVWRNCVQADWNQCYFPNQYDGAEFNPSITSLETIISCDAWSCIGADSTVCADTSLVYPGCPDFVWPGDANSDGIANVWDVLAIGIGYGISGPARTNATTNWVGQPATDWQLQFLNGVNLKHADCDGNAQIDSNDVAVVSLNYGLTHQKGGSPEGRANADLYLEFPQDSANAGDSIVGSIYLGTSPSPVSNIYGIAFSLLYNQNIIDSGSLRIDFTDSWFAPDSNRISLTKDFYLTSKIDAGLSRIDHTNISGAGKIADVSFVIQDNIDGKDFLVLPLEIQFENVLAIDKDEAVVNITANGDTLYVKDEISNMDAINQWGDVKIFPNPVESELKVIAGRHLLEFSITDLTGKKLVTRNNIHSSILIIDVSLLQPGIYFISMKDADNSVCSRKFFILNR